MNKGLLLVSLTASVDFCCIFFLVFSLLAEGLSELKEHKNSLLMNYVFPLE